MAKIAPKQLDLAALSAALGTGGSSPVPVRVTIQPNTTDNIIESLNASVYRSTKWLLTVTDYINNRFKVSEVLALHNGSFASFTQYGQIGDDINFSVDVIFQSNIISLLITNNESHSLVIDAVRVGNITI